MKSSTYYRVNALLKELKSERNQLQAQIDENNLQIYETQSFALELLGKEEDDFKFFSPRKMKDLHRDELEQFDEKKNEYVSKNKGLIVQRDKLDSIIDVLLMVSEESEIDEIDSNLDSNEIGNQLDNDEIENELDSDETDSDLDNEIEDKKSDDLDSELESKAYDNLDGEIYRDLNDWNIYEEIDSESNEDWNLSELDISKGDKIKIANYLQNHVVDNLSDLKHRIELGDKFIRQDPMRTKQGLIVASKKLTDIIDSIKENIFGLKK